MKALGTDDRASRQPLRFHVTFSFSAAVWPLLVSVLTFMLTFRQQHLLGAVGFAPRAPTIVQTRHMSTLLPGGPTVTTTANPTTAPMSRMAVPPVPAAASTRALRDKSPPQQHSTPNRSSCPQTALASLRPPMTCNSRDENCSVIHPPPGSLNALASVLQRAQHKRRLVLAIIGDSIGAGCCTRVSGWPSAPPAAFGIVLAEYLRSDCILGPGRVHVELRNKAKGGQGPRWMSMCSQLAGDEDIVIFENTRPYEVDGVDSLVPNLVCSGAAVILVHWPGRVGMKRPRSHVGFVEAAAKFNLPLIEMNKDIAHQMSCTSAPSQPSRSAGLITSESSYIDSIYSDRMHPNRLGHFLIGCLLREVVDRALQGMDGVDQIVSRTSKTNSMLMSNSACAQQTHPKCFDLNLDDPKLHPQVVRNSGFVLRKHATIDGRTKRWFGSSAPGASITFMVPKSIKIAICYNQIERDMGKASVFVDGVHVAILNGVKRHLDWLPAKNFFANFTVVARSLPEKVHEVTIVVSNSTSGPNASFGFQVTCVASI
mmetsp:Transcript_65703/g.182907  ORF Transcript_65703/g.182907 Transcript_65703/m.182907 type:complete len:540 (-) Transcript_65703:80-1699(-)